MQNLVSIAEAETATGKPARTLQRWAASGRISARRIGARTWLVDLESIRREIQRRKTDS